MKYYIIAGEASGDLHGSNLIKGLRAEDPAAEFRFWGGDLMVAAVCEGRSAEAPVFSAENAPKIGLPSPLHSSGLVRHYKAGAVMGVSDVLAKAGRLSANLKL